MQRVCGVGRGGGWGCRTIALVVGGVVALGIEEAGMHRDCGGAKSLTGVDGEGATKGTRGSVSTRWGGGIQHCRHTSKGSVGQHTIAVIHCTSRVVSPSGPWELGSMVLVLSVRPAELSRFSVAWSKLIDVMMEAFWAKLVGMLAPL